MIGQKKIEAEKEHASRDIEKCDVICGISLNNNRNPHLVLLLRTKTVDRELRDVPEEEVRDGAEAVPQHLHRGLPQQSRPPC